MLSMWENRLILFVGYLINEKRQSSTIKSYISAMKVILQNGGIELSMDVYLLNSLTKACKLHNDSIRFRLLIHKRLLHALLYQVDIRYHDQNYARRLYTALFTMAYYGLF